MFSLIRPTPVVAAVERLAEGVTRRNGTEMADCAALN